jgi:S1-C subfamily serine protease
VVRTDPVRDVALIKVAETNLPALPLRLKTSPNVGDEVYAIGTPRLEYLDVTVTRGIVSAYRDEGGLKYIQSDVQIHPGNSGGPLIDKEGNVVGISVMGLMVSGASQNLNFFVPIAEAVARLRVTIR